MTEQNIRYCIDVCVKEIGFPDTNKKIDRFAKRLEELLILSELLV